MKLKALLLTLVIGAGLVTPLEARHKVKTPKVHHSAAKANKAPKVRHKPAKVKPMKYRKAKRNPQARTSKAPRHHKVKTPKSV
jgi:hypothetical protein